MAKVMISLPDALLRQVDQVAKAEHRKRSEFFKELAMSYLRRWKRKSEFADMEDASATGFDFWNNSVDDETWNETKTR